MNWIGCLPVFFAASETLPIPLDLQTNIIGFAAMSKDRSDIYHISFHHKSLLIAYTMLTR